MDIKRLVNDNRGVSLVEVLLAIAIFAGVIGVTAQSLASFYVSIDIQEQRIEAVNACQGVMDALREKRRQFKNNFPEDLLSWVDAGNAASWEAYMADNSGHQELAEQSITVACYNDNGDAAGATDNPIMVEITTSWKDRKGRTLTASVFSMLTDQ